jgi:hypothetical protein
MAKYLNYYILSCQQLVAAKSTAKAKTAKFEYNYTTVANPACHRIGGLQKRKRK